MESKLIRPLGTFEQLFWLRSEVSTVHMVLAAEIEGVASPEEWRTALDIVQQRHPILSCGIRREKDSSLWFEQVSGKPIPLRVVSGERLFRWESELELELSLLMHNYDAPLIRAALIHFPNKNIVVLTAHHSICDGLSLSYLVRDLLEALSGKGLVPLPFPASSDDLLDLPNEDPDWAPMKSPTLTETQIEGFRNKGKMNVVPRIHTQRLPPELTGQLIRRSREENTTLHGLLVSALLSAGRQVFSKWKEKPVRILSPFSTRELLGIADDCFLCLGSKMIVFLPEDNKPFWEQARFIRSSIAEAREPGKYKEQATGLRKVLNGMDFAGVEQSVEKFLREAVVSNVGRITYNTEFGKFKLVAMWGPTIHSGFGDEYSLGISTVNDTCCLTMTTREPNGHQLLEALTDSLSSHR